MRFCGACVRNPQRLTNISLGEERARWMVTLQAYDRLLWEAMRPEFLQDKVVDPQAFVEGVKGTVVVHADQVPVWLRIGGMKQLYRSSEVKKANTHVTAVPHLSEPGAQVMRVNAGDGMAQTRQFGKGQGDRFRVTVELSQYVAGSEKPRALLVSKKSGFHRRAKKSCR